MKEHTFITRAVMILSTFHFVLVAPSCTAQEKKGDYSKAYSLERVLGEMVKEGVPGCAIAVHSEEGWWNYAVGYAKIEGAIAMRSTHLQYLQSVAKSFMAVGILKLYEEGRIDLEAPMTRYLPAKYSQFIQGADQVSVRMLLNHTSGIPEYNMQPAYVSKLLQDPTHLYALPDYLEFIDGKPLTFVPGSKYSYRNTNYLILALIADAVTGDHAKLLSETIIKPLGMTQTFYRGDPGYLQYPNLVDSYWDRHSDGIVENATVLQRSNVAALAGDDGIVATPEDAVKFLKGLMEGKLLAPATMELMKSWSTDSKGNPTYGLGLDYATLAGKTAYGHSGGGIGAGCQLYYFPEKNVYFFVGINLGTVTESPLHTGVTQALEKIYQALLK